MGRGLANFHNNCALNSILHIFDVLFFDVLRTHNNSNDNDNDDEYPHHQLFNTMVRFIRAINHPIPSTAAINPAHLVSNISSSFRQFPKGEQHDASELFSTLLDNVLIPHPVCGITITQRTHYTTTQRCVCCNCGNVSTTTVAQQGAVVLTLPSTSSSSSSQPPQIPITTLLDDNLNHTTTIDDYHCLCCSAHHRAQIHHHIRTLPHFLVLCVGRWSGTSSSSHQQQQRKNNTGVLTEEVICVEGCSFSSVATIHHIGTSLRSGHYVCFARSFSVSTSASSSQVCVQSYPSSSSSSPFHQSSVIEIIH